jgi:hypothetical protein
MWSVTEETVSSLPLVVREKEWVRSRHRPGHVACCAKQRSSAKLEILRFTQDDDNRISGQFTHPPHELQLFWQVNQRNPYWRRDSRGTLGNKRGGEFVVRVVLGADYDIVGLRQANRNAGGASVAATRCVGSTLESELIGLRSPTTRMCDLDPPYAEKYALVVGYASA